MLLIAEQPAQFGRFRYEAEGRQNCLEGRNEASFPTVLVNPQYKHLIPDGSVMNVTLVTRQNDEMGDPLPHWHVLTSRDGGPVAQVAQT